MADLSDIQAASVVKIVGSNSSGVEQTPVQSTANGGIHSNLRDGSGNELLGTKTSALSIPIVRSEDQSYAAAAAAFVSAGSATDIYNVQGSASKTIKISKIKVSGTTTSGSAIKLTVSLIKRSSANTGGTSVVGTPVPYDSSNAVATAVVRHYTANPSAVGTPVGLIRAETLAITRSGLAGGVLEWNFTDGGQPVILRSASEFLSINFNGTSITGSVISISVEWTEV